MANALLLTPPIKDLSLNLAYIHKALSLYCLSCSEYMQSPPGVWWAWPYCPCIMALVAWRCYKYIAEAGRSDQSAQWSCNENPFPSLSRLRANFAEKYFSKMLLLSCDPYFTKLICSCHSNIPREKKYICILWLIFPHFFPHFLKRHYVTCSRIC